MSDSEYDDNKSKSTQNGKAKRTQDRIHPTIKFSFFRKLKDGGFFEPKVRSKGKEAIMDLFYMAMRLFLTILFALQLQDKSASVFHWCSR